MNDIKIDYKEQYDKLRKVIYSIDAEDYKKDKLKNIYEKNYDPNTERREEAVIEAEANKLIDLQQNFKNMEKNYKKIGLFNEFIRIIKRTGLKFDGCDYLLETDIYRKNKYNSLVDKDMDDLKVSNKQNIKEVEELLKSCSNIPACKTSHGKAPLYAMLQVEQVRVTDARELGLMIQLLSEDTKLLTEFNVDI